MKRPEAPHQVDRLDRHDTSFGERLSQHVASFSSASSPNCGTITIPLAM